MISDSSSKHLAHDLNNIFTRILNSIDLLRRKVPASQEVLPLLNSIEAGTYLASEMVGENLASKTDGKNSRRINLNSIISDAVRSFSIQHKDKIDFKLDLASDLKFILGKYSDYYRVILNLLANSVESISDTGTISLSTRNADNGAYVQFLIRDSGSGIAQENISQIFDESFSTKEKKHASGIGLSSVKKIIDDNEGTVLVSSEAGKGAEFKIILPAAPPAEANSLSQGKTILIAEDEDVLRELLAELLESYNYSVLPASNGREALDIMKLRRPDLLIVDRKMPALDGLDFLEEMAELNYKVPVILAAGSPLETSEKEKVKAERIINKPYNFEELLSLVHELIG